MGAGCLIPGNRSNMITGWFLGAGCVVVRGHWVIVGDQGGLGTLGQHQDKACKHLVTY